MKKYLVVMLFAAAATQQGCAFLGGAALGTLATGAGYEINNKSQMDRLDDDLKNDKISRREYNERKQQIEKGSIIY